MSIIIRRRRYNNIQKRYYITRSIDGVITKTSNNKKSSEIQSVVTTKPSTIDTTTIQQYNVSVAVPFGNIPPPVELMAEEDMLMISAIFTKKNGCCC